MRYDLKVVRRQIRHARTLRFSIGLGVLTHTIPDPIILSDEGSVGSRPDSDFSSLDIDLTAKHDFYLHVADNDLVDGDLMPPQSE